MKRLKELRKSNNLTLFELSRQLDISPQVISRYELEERKADYETLHKIATFFDVSIDYLLGYSDYYYPDKISSAIAAYSSDEQQLISDYNKLNSHSKKYLQDTIKMLLESASVSEKNRIS